MYTTQIEIINFFFLQIYWITDIYNIYIDLIYRLFNEYEKKIFIKNSNQREYLHKLLDTYEIVMHLDISTCISLLQIEERKKL